MNRNSFPITQVTKQVSGNNVVERDRPAEIVVTEEMIEAGLEEFLSHHYGCDPRFMLESIFRAMAYASPAASAIIPSK